MNETKNNTSVSERVNVSLKLKRDLIKKVKDLAAKQNRSFNNYIETVLEAIKG